MVKWIKNLFTPKQKAYALFTRLQDRRKWVKVVSTSRPHGFFKEDVVGPFRSEVDCEDFCDVCNNAEDTIRALKHNGYEY